MRNFKILAIILLIIAAVTSVQFSKKQEKIIDTKQIKIGILTITTGDLAFLGENIVRSAELVAQELNEDGYNIELVVEDVGGFGKSAETVSAFKKLVEIDRVNFIIDGVSSNDTMAIAPLIDQYRIPIVTPLTGGENIDNAGEFLFRNGPSDIMAGIEPANDFNNKFSFRSVALLTDKAEYTLDIIKHFKKNYTGTIVLDETVVPDQKDYKTEALKLKNSGAEALLINTATGISSSYIIKQIRELGINIPIFTNFLAYGPNFLSIAGKASEGVYIYDVQLDADSENVQLFVKKYREKYGSDPIILFHATGTHDAIRMGVEAIDSVGFDGKKIHDYLLDNIQNWKGLNGSVSFDTNGNTDNGFILRQVRDGMLTNPLSL